MTVRELEAARSGDDRIESLTRVVSWVIAPFLVVAFAVLYPWPADTGRVFAWRIAPTMTAMVLGSAYLGGAYFFVRAALATGWHTIKAGFPPVGVFAALLGIATIVHWAKFSHGHVAFWLWAGLYFTTPFLILAVWLRNRRYDRPAEPGDLLLPDLAARVIGTVGVVALAAGLFLFFAPARAIRIWPWTLTPLTARVLGAVFCLGLAGVGAFTERRWSSARLPFQVAGIMLVFIVAAGLRAHAQFASSNALTWLFAAGFVGITATIGILYVRMERRAATR